MHITLIWSLSTVDANMNIQNFLSKKLFIAHIDMVSLQYECNGDCLATVSLSEPVLPFLFQWKRIIFRFFLCRTAVCIPILHWSLWYVNLILMVSTCMHTCLSHFFFQNGCTGDAEHRQRACCCQYAKWPSRFASTRTVRSLGETHRAYIS